MNYRHLGQSGLVVSEIAYGNWITHGSQVEKETAIACVRAALEVGITTFDTADIYAKTKAEEVLGESLAGQRRAGLEIFTKVYWPTGPGMNDRGLSRKHIMESIDGSLRRLRTEYVDLYQAHRYDFETPLEETMLAFADLVRAGKVLYVGVSEWTAEQIGRAGALARAEGAAYLQPAAVFDAVAGDRGGGGSGLREAGDGADCMVADGAGRAEREVPAGSAAAGGQPGDGCRGRAVHCAVYDR